MPSTSWTPREPYGYQQLTVAGTAVSLTVPTSSATAFSPNYALIAVETAQVRWRDDGTAPTAGVGMLMNPGDSLVYDGDIGAIQFIRVTPVSGIVNVSYYR